MQTADHPAWTDPDQKLAAQIHDWQATCLRLSMRPHRTFSCLLALLLAVGQISVTTCQPDPYEEYDADEDSYGAGGMFGGDSPDTPGPGPPLQQHIHGIVDVDALTFDKVVIAPDRPAFVLFYDVDQKPEDQVGVSWILGKVAERMSDHMRLLLVKIDASAASARALKQRFGITTLPTHVLLEGADKQTLYVMDHKDADAAGKLEGWLLEQVRTSSSSQSRVTVITTSSAFACRLGH